jgi:hypothetical protein
MLSTDWVFLSGWFPQLRSISVACTSDIHYASFTLCHRAAPHLGNSICHANNLFLSQREETGGEKLTITIG